MKKNLPKEIHINIVCVMIKLRNKCIKSVIGAALQLKICHKSVIKETKMHNLMQCRQHQATCLKNLILEVSGNL